MTINTDRQYRVLTQSETTDNDGVSCHFYQRCADNINNWFSRVGNFPLIWTWNVESGSSVTPVVSAQSTTNHTVVLLLGKVFLDPAYEQFRVFLQGRVFIGAPGSTLWTISAATTLYGGTQLYQDGFVENRTALGLTISSSSWEIQTGTLSIPSRTSDDHLYLFLSATNSDNTVRTNVCALTLQPV